MAEFYKTKLKNGLTILFERRDLPVVAILVATRAGAAYEVAEKKGIAHFSEHMLFKGTKTKTASEISSSIEKVGGILNGFTSNEITAFWCKLPSKHFSDGADIIFDLVANPKFDDKEILKEKGVILSEISASHDFPMNYLFDKIKELLYKKPFGMPILGFKETVSKLKRADFLEWHKYYCPENLIISIVGSASLKEIQDIAKRYFEKPCRGKILQKLILLRKNGSLIDFRGGLDQTHLALGIHAPSFSNKKKYASELFNAILGEGMSSRLFSEVREKRGLAYTIRSLIDCERNYGSRIIYAGIEKKNIKKVKEIILKEIKKMIKLNAKDLEEAKEQKIGNYELGLEACDGVATNLALQEISTKAEDFYNYVNEILNVSLKDVREMAKIKNYSFAVLAPK